MITVLKNGTTPAQTEELVTWLRAQGVDVNISQSEQRTLLLLSGQTQRIDAELLTSLDCIESVKRITEDYRHCDRHAQQRDTVIRVGDALLGGGNFAVIAGPCSIETPEQIIAVAQAVKAAGAQILRGGAFKPRTSPYDFQGLGAEGLRLLLEAKKAVGLPIVTEIMNINTLDLFDDVDIIQVGARNMQNFDLLRELGKTKKTILLKRGMASTLRELLMSAEYIMAEGNENVSLCERGIRSFDSYARNTLDLAAVPMLKELSHLPILVDPSHATGKRSLVEPMALAAAACGADGVMVEVHNDPVHALCDGGQSLTTEQFAELSKKLCAVREAIR